MLLSFRVQNFRSIDRQQELSLLATRHKALSDCLGKHDEVKHGILPVIVVFGANAAGKTTLHNALTAFSNAVDQSHRSWKTGADLPFEPHFFSNNSETLMEASFLLGGLPYRFGFTCTRGRFTREWLFQGKKRIYERTGEEFDFGRSYKGSKGIKFYTRSNALFLSTAAQNNHEILTPISEWISNWMSLSDESPIERFFTGRILKDRNAKQFLIDALRIIDPQIVDVTHEEGATMSRPFQVIDSNFQTYLEHVEQWEAIEITRADENSKKTSRINIRDESAGTRRYLSLIGPLAVALSVGTVILIDEADSSLHPTLLKAILQLFHSPRTNPKCSQLIINSHDTTLLNTGVLRPDEVYFVEKEGSLGSVLYSLADFSGVRSEISAQRQYLEGRFGALPFLDDHLEIFARQVSEEPEYEKSNVSA